MEVALSTCNSLATAIAASAWERSALAVVVMNAALVGTRREPMR
jgi:hypothetical protein